MSSGSRASTSGVYGDGLTCPSVCGSTRICGRGDRRFCAALFIACLWHRNRHPGRGTAATSSVCGNISPAIPILRLHGNPQLAGARRLPVFSNGSKSRKYISWWTNREHLHLPSIRPRPPRVRLHRTVHRDGCWISRSKQHWWERPWQWK